MTENTAQRCGGAAKTEHSTQTNGRVQRFWRELSGKRIAFIGVGVSHTELICQMARRGLDVTLCDKRTREELGGPGDELAGLGVKLVTGNTYLEDICTYDVIFRTPGMNYFHKRLCAARAAGCVVTSEMEVFLDLCPCKKIGVTGSDGKTTTTTLISEMLRAAGKTVHLGGNIGKPLLCRIEEVSPEDFAVVEMSSFQLISMRQAVDIAVVTNVAPNHLDVHKDMAEYIAAKENLLLHQNAFSRTVLNLDNDITRSMEHLVRGELLHFSRTQPVKRGAFLDKAGHLCTCYNNHIEKLFPMEEIRIPGIHNVENYLTAIAAVHGLVPAQAIRSIACEFGGVEHRIELVRELNGARWYNDSIASSPTRTNAGLASFAQKVILIAGGYDKKIPFEPLAPMLVEKVKHLILMGATAPKIEAAVKACPGYAEGTPPIHHVSSMEEAVQTARSLAQRGDVVTLSPACASFDYYKNFEERGKHFKQLVCEMEE